MIDDAVRSAPVILDGTSLARQRADMLAARAALVREQRGRPPLLLLLAFAEPNDRVPHVAPKLRACRHAGIDALPVTLPAGASTAEAIAALDAALATAPVDGVFVQFPFPDAIDGAAIGASIPPALDVDSMTRERAETYLSGPGSLPPVTVSAALLLLEAYGIDVSGRRGIVVAHESPFAEMFRAALERLGASMEPLVPPDAADLPGRLASATLVVAAAAQPGLVPASSLADDSVAIDVGYFNPGGRGDIDVSGGIAHLAALAPVPGGIGPMTVSALLERVVTFAEEA